MENYNRSEPQEIVLTYRSEERIQPVVLRYERELPPDMRKRLFPEEPALKESIPVWDRRSRQKRRRSPLRRLVTAVAVLALLVGIGMGLRYLDLRLAPQLLPPVDDRPGGEDAAPPVDEEEYYYWEEDDFYQGVATIEAFRPDSALAPRLTLTPAGESAAVLTPGQIYQRVAPATVTVLGRETEEDARASVGTGIIFHGDGYILTNYHVIAGCAAAEVWVTNEYGVDTVYDALLVGGDMEQDVAVLKIEAEGLPTAELGISDELRVGDKVYAIGNPLGVDLRGTFTDGIVSAVNREVVTDEGSMVLIQTNAALNSGNSGGPLINQYGQVVGVNTMKMMSGYDTIEGLGFAIPTSYAVRWVNEIIQTGQIEPTPLLGLTIMRIPDELPDGTMALMVESVTRGGSGDRAGVVAGDYIVAFNGQRVHTTEDILLLRRDLRVGDEVSISIWRDGEYMELTMVLQSAEAPALPENKQ